MSTDETAPIAPLAASEVPAWNLEADVVVVGLGAAGASAAIEAADAGADVLVLEREFAGGGTSALSGGSIYLGGGTPLQRACGFDDTPEDMYRYLRASVQPGPDDEWLRAYCDGSVELYEWLVARGVPFKAEFLPPERGTYPWGSEHGLSYTGSELAHPFSALARPAPRGHHPQHPGEGGGLVLMEALSASAVAAGARIQTSALCERLVIDGPPEAPRVVGLEARIERETRYVRASRGVILCAGGFVMNEGMLRQYAPELLQLRNRLGNDGSDGAAIRMGLGLGAALDRMEWGMVNLTTSPPRRLVKGVLVDHAGRRFVNEDQYRDQLGPTALYDHGGVVFMIVDDETYRRPVLAQAEIVAVAESYEELERELDMPEGNLQRTMASYNEHAARGEDPEFHKAAEWLEPLDRPPFAALDFSITASVWSGFPIGGLQTAMTGEVLREDGSPIAGLYAAGRTTPGLQGRGYSSGLSLGDCTFFGRWAGRAAAAAGRVRVP